MFADSGDQELLTALRAALDEASAVPAEFIRAARSAFAWRTIDADLAELTYDSLTSSAPADVRSESAPVRALTFSSAHLTIELEVVGDTLIGQLVPGQPGTVTVQAGAGDAVTIDTDDIGRFTLQPVPAGRFRLSCRTAAVIETLTGWITVQPD